MIFFQGLGEFVNTKFFCRVCALLHDDVASGRDADAGATSYADINEWWRGAGTCINGSWRKFKKALESASEKEEKDGGSGGGSAAAAAAAAGGGGGGDSGDEDEEDDEKLPERKE